MYELACFYSFYFHPFNLAFFYFHKYHRKSYNFVKMHVDKQIYAFPERISITNFKIIWLFTNISEVQLIVKYLFFVNLFVFIFQL